MTHNLNSTITQTGSTRKRAARNQQDGASKGRRLNDNGNSSNIPPVIATAPMLNSPRPVSVNDNNNDNSVLQLPSPVQAPRTRTRPAPKPKQTINNLNPQIFAALSESKAAYDNVISEFESDYGSVAVVTGVAASNLLSNNLNVVNSGIKNPFQHQVMKYKAGSDHCDAEYDALYDAMKTAASMGFKLGDDFWGEIPGLIGSTRSGDAYRNRFNKLRSGKLKGKYRNSEFAALHAELAGFKSESNCVSS